MVYLKRAVYFFSLLIAFYSCKEEEKATPISIDASAQKVFVLNEGNFRSGNASISLYYPENGTVEHDIFKKNNQNRPLGDVVQSIVQIEDKAFIVVNNSTKIEVVDVNTFESIATINGLNSPRYILPISSTKAYVSDLYEDKIYIINPKTYSITSTISTNGWTEEMVLVDEKAFICQIDSNQLYVIDTKNDSIVQRINTNKSPSSIGVDESGKVWVACSGGLQDGYPAIHKIDPITFQIEKSLIYEDVSKSISHLTLGPNARKIYFVMDGLYKISISDSEIPTSPFIEENTRNFYGMSVDPFNGDIYLCDAIDYQQSGVVYRYDANGKEVANFKAGLIPANFFFN